MSALNKNIPGGTFILLALVIVPIVWLFATQETGDEKLERQNAEFVSQIPSVGTIGSWYDDLQSKSYGDSTITISANGGQYSAVRVSGDGSKSLLKLTRKDGNVFVVDNDKFGASYVITPAGLEIHDRQGLIRTATPIK